MIRFTLIAFLFFLKTLNICAQAKNESESLALNTEQKRAYIGLSLGFSIPFGSFSADNTTTQEANFAKRGQNIHLLDFGYRLKESIHLGGTYLSSQNGIDNKKVADYFNSLSNLKYSVESNSYELNALLLGGGFTKTNQSIDLDMLFMLGVGNLFLPNMTIRQTDGANEEVFLIGSDKKTSFGVGIKGGFRIHLTEYLDFTTHGTFLVFENKFDQDTNVLNTNGEPIQLSSTITYQVFNVNFGLAYRFL